MPTINQITEFAASGTVQNGDVLDVADYAADPQTATGHQAGIARRELENTVLRQLSRFCKGVAQFIAEHYGPGVVDDGDVEKVVDGLEAAIVAVAPAPPQATTEAQGIVEQATIDEAVAGTDNSRYVTPAGLAAATATINLKKSFLL